MAVDWESVQKRFIDPFSPVDSDNVSSLTAAISYGTGRGVCNGLILSLVSGETLQVSTGVVLKDFVVIRFTVPVVIDIEDTSRGAGDNYIVLSYHYVKESPAPVAIIDVIPVIDYLPGQHVILGTAVTDLMATSFLSISKEGREENTSVKRTEDTSILELCDTPDWCQGIAPYAGQAHQILRVNVGETGFSFSDDLTKADPADPAPGYVCDKIDKFTLDLCAANHTICVVPYTVNADMVDDLHGCDFLQLSGATSPCCDISWDNWKITDLANPSDPQDAVNFQCLNSCIDAEALARSTCDNELQAQITSNCGLISQLCIDLSSEGTTRCICDTNLQNQIDDLCSGATPVACADYAACAGDADTLDGCDSTCFAAAIHSHVWSEVSKSGSSVTDLGDVNTSGAGLGCVLCYNGSSWIPGTAAGGGGAASFIALSDTPPAHCAGCYLCSTGTVLCWTSPPGVPNMWATFTGDAGSTTADCTTDTICIQGGTAISTAIVGDVLTVTYTGSSATGKDCFDQLDDVVPGYGSAGDLVCSNGTDCIGYTSLSSLLAALGQFTDLCDTPADYTGCAGCFLKVNGTEDGLIFTPDPAAGGVACLSDVGNVNIAGIADGYILRYDYGNSCWYVEEYVPASGMKTIANVVQQCPSSGYTQNFVFGSPTLDYSGQATRMFLNKTKVAFRAGGDPFGLWNDALVGSGSMVVGAGEASGNGSAIFGAGTSTGFRSTVIMDGIAECQWSLAMGSGAKACTNNHTVAIGNSSVATGLAAIALAGGEASGTRSVALGICAVASECGAVALGTAYTLGGACNIASGCYSLVGGCTSTASGDGSFSFGCGTQVIGSHSAAFGRGSCAGKGAAYHGDFAAGYFACATGGTSAAFNNCAVASGSGAFAMNYHTIASGGYSLAQGCQSVASGIASVAMGTSSTASGPVTTALGACGTAAGDYSVIVGLSPTAYTVSQDHTMSIMGGKLGVGTTTPSRTLWVSGDAGGSYGWENDSDARLKKNVIPIGDALSKVERLKGVCFNWIDTENHLPGNQIGLIAQDVDEVIPEIVGKKGEYWSLQYGPVVALLIEAIKEQQHTICELRDSVSDLEDRISLLEHETQ